MACALPVVAAAYLNVAIFQATDHYELQGSMSIPYNAFLAVFLVTLGAKWGIKGVVIAVRARGSFTACHEHPYAKKEHYVCRRARPQGGHVGTYFKTALVTVLTTSIFPCSAISSTRRPPRRSTTAPSGAFYYADKKQHPARQACLYNISAVMFL